MKSNEDSGVSKETSGHPNAEMTVFTIALLTMITIISVVFVQGLFYQVQRQQEASKELSANPAEILQLESKELEKLATFGWTDVEQGRVRIPLELAIEHFLKGE